MAVTAKNEIIYVLDYGSQFSHLITRKIRELGTYAELVPHNCPLAKLARARGIILSGGPQNLSNSDALRIDSKVYNLGVPILGICYGMQLTAYELGGQVVAGKKREYGPTEVNITRRSPIFSGLEKIQNTWMSHGDQVSKLPRGFAAIAASPNCRYAAIADEKRKIYGLQFHPEVAHTENGKKILEAFVKITGAKSSWRMTDFVNAQITAIKQKIKSAQAVCALSGGVDSAVAATLVHRAIGKNLTCIYVDTGLMRQGETEQIKKAFTPSPLPRREGVKMKLVMVNAKQEFLQKLRGVTDPEQKRKAVGELFIRIFEREAKKLKKAKYLVQGTLYTDAITSGVSVGKTAALIKSHHNVGGLPEKLGFALVEPLRELYKDEVRKIGKLLGLPRSIVERQPFPGPGLAVRIIGAVTEEKLELLRKADWIVREELEKAGQAKSVQQYFAVLPSLRSVGVQGDARTYGHAIIVRAVTTADYLTAHWARLPYELLEKISARITNEVQGVNRVVYDITSKPPGTVEWE